ncbi:nucleotide-binding alpha-beta plait domain-containing protein [Tanacetum coccineum]
MIRDVLGVFGVGTTLDIFFQINYIVPYLDTGVLSPLDTALLSLYLLIVSFGECRPGYAGNNKGNIDNIICQLGSSFALKDLGPLNYFLGIEIVLHMSGILLSQKKYILELLQSAGLSNCNRVSSHMVTSSSLSMSIYALRYLHGTVEHGMLIRRSSGFTLQAFTDVLWKGNPDTSFEAFLDADWAGDSDDRRSTRGFAIYLYSNLISWTAHKQCTISCSSTEAEYKALADIPPQQPHTSHHLAVAAAGCSQASFRHVQGTTSCDLWLSLKKAYAPHSTSRGYTLKTQLLRIKMHGDETPDAYLNRAQEYANALTTIGEPVKDKDLVMLVVLGLREEYNGLKTTIIARQSPTAFNELHVLLSDHDYMLGKTRASAPSIT